MDTQHAEIPPHLAHHAALHQQDPRQASLAWFREAKFGLFMHFGLYSLLGRHEWVMYREAIPVSEYEQLQGSFRAEHFDADAITDLALEAGMTYVNITARHHESFCLFESQVSTYSSVHSPAGRDLVGELAEQCHKKGLGLFVYYSYALDWRHPYFYPRAYLDIARPDYEKPEPRYQWRRDADFAHYIDFVHVQIRELLTQYGPLAGIWFDPIMGYYARPDLFPIHETYALVRQLQPHALIAFKQGATGTEDFASPERHGHSLAERVRQRIGPEAAQVADHAWQNNRAKHNEICDTLQPNAWGYKAADDSHHRSADEVLQMLADAHQQECNLLLNTGPLPDGTIHPDDQQTLRSVGLHIRKHGWP
jgi:alpha-L-fucosidase